MELAVAKLWEQPGHEQWRHVLVVEEMASYVVDQGIERDGVAHLAQDAAGNLAAAVPV